MMNTSWDWEIWREREAGRKGEENVRDRLVLIYLG